MNKQTKQQGIITDMLAWQQEMDESGFGGPNQKGSARFWKTVERHLGTVTYRNGAPEFSEIVIELTDDVGLMLYVDPLDGGLEMGVRPRIEYRFVEIVEREEKG